MSGGAVRFGPQCAAAAPAPVIEIDDVCRVYPGAHGVRALDHVSLRIEAGEFVAIMGPSGSGKSTLLAMLGCLDRPDSGNYRLSGRDVTRLSEPALALVRNRYLGFVFQSFNLLPRTSALDNVALPLFYGKGPAPAAARRRDRARLMLKLVGLLERERHTPAQLSGGQQQRVAIARALVNAPHVLLADEPTGNLDSAASREVMRIFRELNRTGLTIVMVTHEPDAALHAGRVLTLRDGRIVSDERREVPGAEGGAAPAWPQQADERGAMLGRLFRHRPRARAGAADGAAFAAMVLSAALTSIRRNRLRSSLTMLGIFIGVAALVAMVAVGQGAGESVRRQLEGLGTQLLVVLPKVPDGAVAGGGGFQPLTQADANALGREVMVVDKIGFGVQQSGVVYSLGRSALSTLQGVSLRYPELLQWHLTRGRSFSEVEENEAALVCLIGLSVARRLFDAAQNPVGAVVLVRGTPMRVIGLLSPKGQSAFGTDQDDVVIMPFTTAQRRVLGAATAAVPTAYTPPGPGNPLGVPPRLDGQVQAIYARARSERHVEAAVAQVTQVLRRRHGLRDGQPADFSVGTLTQLLEAARSGARAMTILLAAVSSISLLVGGIGIMNILLVSVTERTREIGLRMAIGARRRQVMLQFLAEATLLSTFGGVAGVVAGGLAAAAISWLASWPTIVSAASVFGGLVFATAVGLVFGVVPARKAARLEPMQAMRHE